LRSADPASPDQPLTQGGLYTAPPARQRARAADRCRGVRAGPLQVHTAAPRRPCRGRRCACLAWWRGAAAGRAPRGFVTARQADGDLVRAAIRLASLPGDGSGLDPAATSGGSRPESGHRWSRARRRSSSLPAWPSTANAHL